MEDMMQKRSDHDYMQMAIEEAREGIRHVPLDREDCLKLFDEYNGMNHASY